MTSYKITIGRRARIFDTLEDAKLFADRHFEQTGAILGIEACERAAKPLMTLERAKALYVHRFTMEHVPQWALKAAPNGKYYAPQYASDAEWYSKTLFPPNNPFHKRNCHSQSPSWPLGTWLDSPFDRKAAA